MTIQIERLQAQFNSLSLEKKSGFIKNLQDELRHNSDPEWRAHMQPFISRCIREYNEEIKRPAAAVAREAPRTCSCGSPLVAGEKFCVRCGLPASSGASYQPAASGTSYDSGRHQPISPSQGSEVFNDAVGNAKMAYEISLSQPPLPALSEGEQVVRSYHCIKKGLIFQANGYLTATNRRILFQGHSMFTKANTEVPLDAVSVINSGVVKFSFLHILIALSFFVSTYIYGRDVAWMGIGLFFAGVVFIVLAFWPRCSLSIKVSNNSGPPPVLLNALLRNKSSFELKGRPGRDTFIMMRELGAMIIDLQKLGDLGVRKWTK